MVFEYSYWWLFPIVIVSGVVAYRKFKKMSKLPDIRWGIAFFISSLRFIVITVLLALLLKPAVSFVRSVYEKPLLIIAQDNSASLVNNKDSLYYRKDYKESLERLNERLKQKFDVELLTFGLQVKKTSELDFSEVHTDISAVFDYTERNFILKRPVGMVLLTDGIYNTGVNPKYKTTSFPVYAVGLGDTTRYPDIYIKSVESNKFNFIHTIFPVKVEVAAVKQKGKRVKCVLKENGNKIAEKELLIDKDRFFTETTFEVEAKRSGVIRYTIEIASGDHEHTLENNRSTVYVNIIDNTGNIDIYYESPHPDIAALVNAINVSGIYTCTGHRLKDPVQEDRKANLIILHNPDPAHPNYRKIIERARKQKISLWYILTSRESIGALARFGKDYSVDFGSNTFEYATVHFNRDFPYFEFTDAEIADFMEYPPLVVPFGEIKSNAGRLLFTQKIKNTPVANGMLGFYDVQGQRIGYLWGEGLWRWRLYSYKEHGNHELFNTLVNKSVNYLATRHGADRFIHDIKPLYEETEEIIINAELYNESYELVNTPDVKLEMKAGDREFNYVLNRNGDKYRIDLGNLSAGEYDYRLHTDLKGEHFDKKGVFYVRSWNVELNNMVADRQVLQDIATHSGGKFLELKDLDQLTTALEKSDHFRPVYKNEVRYVELSEWGILGLLLLLLLCTEWFLLKYFVG